MLGLACEPKLLEAVRRYLRASLVDVRVCTRAKEVQDAKFAGFHREEQRSIEGTGRDPGIELHQEHASQACHHLPPHGQNLPCILPGADQNSKGPNNATKILPHAAPLKDSWSRCKARTLLLMFATLTFSLETIDETRHAKAFSVHVQNRFERMRRSRARSFSAHMRSAEHAEFPLASGTPASHDVQELTWRPIASMLQPARWQSCLPLNSCHGPKTGTKCRREIHLPHA